MAVRIIPRLDIKGPNLVKGIHLEGLRVLGKPERFARHYYEGGADELIYIDSVASLYGRNNLLEIVQRTAREIFIPLTVGGGLRTIEDMRAVLRVGADKVAINTAAIKDPGLIRRASRFFGSSTIVVSIAAHLKQDGRYEAYINYGRQRTGFDAVEWARQASDLGSGEILLTPIHREGTGKGYDLELTKTIAEEVPCPVIACGGAGNPNHVHDVIVNGAADAVSLASVLHYRYIKDNHGSNGHFSEGNVDFLNSSRRFTKVEPHTLAEIKAFLVERGVTCRYNSTEYGYV
ncbi:imidazole glycerol phosphate synthase subunit HisF [Thermodesulfobacteriota bacterium]